MSRFLFLVFKFIRTLYTNAQKETYAPKMVITYIANELQNCFGPSPNTSTNKYCKCFQIYYYLKYIGHLKS